MVWFSIFLFIKMNIIKKGLKFKKYIYIYINVIIDINNKCISYYIILFYYINKCYDYN